MKLETYYCDLCGEQVKGPSWLYASTYNVKSELSQFDKALCDKCADSLNEAIAKVVEERKKRK